MNLAFPYITVASLLCTVLQEKNCEKEKKNHCSNLDHSEKMPIAKLIVSFYLQIQLEFLSSKKGFFLIIRSKLVFWAQESVHISLGLFLNNNIFVIIFIII